MKIHITDLTDESKGKDAKLATLVFDKSVTEVKGFENIPVLTKDMSLYLDVTSVSVPGADPVLVRGGYNPEKRHLGLYVASNQHPVLTLLAFCPSGPRYSPTAIVRLPTGQVLQFLAEADA